MNEQKPKISSSSSPRGRTHPNLRALDAMTLSYTGWSEDKEDAEDCHYNYPSLVPGKIEGMKRKQILHDGDRSHPNLVTLDSFTWTYSDWMQDKAEAEEYHCIYPSMVADQIQGMQRKQKVYDGDRSHPDLVTLDKTYWSYSGFEMDKAEAEDCHFDHPSLVAGMIDAMQRKQKLFDGGSSSRSSHPNLVALDAANWTYHGWEDDKQDAEDLFFNYPAQLPDKIAAMQRKQSVLVNGDRSHPNLVTLDSFTWTYPDWMQDKADAEDYHFDYPSMVADQIQGMQRKQKVYDGDRSHPDLVTLDRSTNWSYSGWEKDKAECEDCHFHYPTLVAGKIKGMQRKQQVHNDDTGSSSFCPIVIKDDVYVQQGPVRKRQKRGDKKKKVASRMPTKDSSSLCVVCLKTEKTHAFDCGHACVCQACSTWALLQRQNKAPTCPYCSRPITFARAITSDDDNDEKYSTSYGGGALIDLSTNT